MTIIELLVSHYEALHDGDLHAIGLQPKMCPAGYWTEGYGRVIRDVDGTMLEGISNKAKAYKLSKIHTVEQALQALDEDLTDYSNRVRSLGLILKEYEHFGLVSFSYNVGFDALKGSTLLKLIRKGVRGTQIAVEFSRWNKSKKKVMPGLTARRSSEAYLFNTGNLKFFN